MCAHTQDWQMLTALPNEQPIKVTFFRGTQNNGICSYRSKRCYFITFTMNNKRRTRMSTKTINGAKDNTKQYKGNMSNQVLTP